MPNPIRAAAGETLPPRVARALRDAHARRVVKTFPVLISDPASKKYLAHRWLPDLELAAVWLTRQPPSLKALHFIDLVRYLGLSNRLRSGPR